MQLCKNHAEYHKSCLWDILCIHWTTFITNLNLIAYILAPRVLVLCPKWLKTDHIKSCHVWDMLLHRIEPTKSMLKLYKTRFFLKIWYKWLGNAFMMLKCNCCWPLGGKKHIFSMKKRQNDQYFIHLHQSNFKMIKRGVDVAFFKFLFLDTTDKTCEKHVYYSLPFISQAKLV